MQQATVLFCHGSRNVDWRAPFDLLAADVQRRLPEQRVCLAFLELMSPTLPEVLTHLAERGVERIQVVPLFLAPGAHTRRDLPALVAQAREQWPVLQVEVLPTLLESGALRNVLAEALGSATPLGPSYSPTL